MAKKDAPISIEQLLCRPDIWRGHSHSFVKEAIVDSGHPKLNQALQHRGWPIGDMIEVCQSYHACEWWLFHSAIKTLTLGNAYGHMALINPPALPFVSGLKQLNIPIQRMIVVQPKTPQEFVSCFAELSRSSICSVILAWQNELLLNYTQLRKLQLSTAGQSSLFVIFRHLRVKAHSSPASLRLTVQPQPNTIHIHIFKQRGKLHQLDIELPIPPYWQKLPPHRNLHLPQENQLTALSTAVSSTKTQLSLFPNIVLPVKKRGKL